MVGRDVWTYVCVISQSNDQKLFQMGRDGSGGEEEFLGVLEERTCDGHRLFLSFWVQGCFWFLSILEKSEGVIELLQFMLLFPKESRELSLQSILFFLFSFLQLDQTNQLLICLPCQLPIFLYHALQGPKSFLIVIFESMPKVIGLVVAILLAQFGPQEKDFFCLVEMIADQECHGIIVFVATGLEFESSQAVEEFCEVLFIPVQGKIEMGVRCDRADEDPASLSLYIVTSHEDANFSQLELVIFCHDGVVVVVVEEHDVWSVLETVTAVVDAFVLALCDYVSVVG